MVDRFLQSRGKERLAGKFLADMSHRLGTIANLFLNRSSASSRDELLIEYLF